MPYETYEEKWVWDTPMKGLVNEDTGVLLPDPPTLRKRRLGSVVHHSDFDIEKHINSEDGMMQARQWYNVTTCQDEMDPQVLAYWEKFGWKKVLHDGEDYDKKWSAFLPLSSFREENHQRLYPLYFVLHGGNTPPYEMEGYGFCEPTAKDEPIIAIPHDFSIDGVLAVYQYCVDHYPVDKSRVYITSYCGGNHANFVALRYPELFAAIAPCGNPLRENYKPVMWYPDYERVRRLGLPCCHMDGLDDLTQLLPIYKESTPALSDDPDYPARIYNMPLAKREYKLNTLRDYLFIFDCKDVTAEELFACENSQNEAIRRVGVPADVTEIRTVRGKKHYVCKFRNSDGNLWLEIVGIESMGHFPDSTLGVGAWEFLRQFRRNQETGRIELIGADKSVFTKDPGSFDHNRYLHYFGSREHGYNTAWDGRSVNNGI